MIHIDPNNRMPIYRQIIQQIKLQIMSGRLQPGQQLESVSNLSSRLAINPMTVSKAYGFLVDQEMVERRRGVGIFVAKVSTKNIDQERHLILSDARRSAAGLALQLAVPPQDASKLLNQHLEDLQNKWSSIE
ncbi:MAG: GntR family transcriptional regulator [Gemmatimonadales bacterium]|nr:GntR family transcriptional regulator [Gemmatimonadales bacterium]